MRIVIGSDHAGFPLKATITEHIRSLGHEVHDAKTVTSWITGARRSAA
jgi:ribose 5-phosphate isomerase RpiB